MSNSLLSDNTKFNLALEIAKAAGIEKIRADVILEQALVEAIIERLAKKGIDIDVSRLEVMKHNFLEIK